MLHPTSTSRTAPARGAALLFAFAVLIATLLSAEPARAFTYPEHVVITRRALVALVRDEAITKPAALKALSALKRFVKDVPDEKPGYRLDIDLDRPLKANEFNVADLVALAADHSVSPGNLLDRWFWTVGQGSQCTGRNLREGFSSIDNSEEPPTKCMKRGEHPAVNREGFLKLVRSFYNGDGSIQSTTWIDPDLSSNDCAYICLAVRGRTHFRIPTMNAEDASYRPDFPNGASSYAMNHAVAVALAMTSAEPGDDGDKRLGLALLYEAFALHYLQDGVAAGHIIPSHYGYGNITVNGTHDYYNRAGVKVSIPHEICDRMILLGLEKHFGRLYRHCHLPRDIDVAYEKSAIVRGDHAIANKLDALDDADVTRELAEMLSVWSLREVVRAPAEAGWLEWMRKAHENEIGGLDELLESRLHEARESAHESLELDVVNAVFSPDLSRIETYRMLRRQREYFSGSESRKREIFAPLGAIEMWPTLFVPQPLVEAPGGHNLYYRVMVRNASLPRTPDLVVSAGAGYGFMATVYRQRVQFDSDIFSTYASTQVSTTLHHFGFGIRNAFSAHWAKFGGLSLVNQLGVTVEMAPRVVLVPEDERYSWQVTTSLTPLSYEIASDLNSFTMGVVTGIGWLGASAPSPRQFFGFAGIELGGTYHPPRPIGPLPAVK